MSNAGMCMAKEGEIMLKPMHESLTFTCPVTLVPYAIMKQKRRKIGKHLSIAVKLKM
jgi:hypothetical protein